MANCRDLAFKFDELNKVYLLLGTVLVVLIIGIVAYLKYQNFTFIWTMKMKSLLLMKEFFNKKTIIQLNRIQQVNISP
jgi:putative membrane protein